VRRHPHDEINMTRARRYILNGFVALSLHLCVATVVLWIWSYQSPWGNSRQLSGSIGPNGGFDRVIDSNWKLWSNQGMLWIEPPHGVNHWDIPYWKIVVLWLISPAWQLIPWKVWSCRKNPVSLSLCPTCGYDLRATPDRCPECGKIPEKVKA
jgi:hypothetical protein